MPPAELEERLEADIARCHVLLRASEDWEPGYRENAGIFEQLLKAEAKFQRDTRKYLRGLGERAGKLVLWDEYARLKAAGDSPDVVVSIEDAQWDAEGRYILQDTLDNFVVIQTLGAEAAEALYRRPIGVADSNAAIIKEATDYAGTLIKQHLNPTSREVIRQSIATSIKLGEKRAEAVARLQSNVVNLKRADMIAQTETVGSFGRGNYYYAKAAGAYGKEWLTSLGPCPICSEVPKQGIIALEQPFRLSNGKYVMFQGAHPYCKCRVRYHFR